MFAALLVQPASWAPSSLAHSPSSSVVHRARPCVAALEWEECNGCQLLRPQQGRPRAMVHFLGGVLVSPAPQVAYRYMLEQMAERGYLVVATPYAVDFDYRKPAAEIRDKFDGARSMLADEYGGALPLLSLGHSLGALMQTLLYCQHAPYTEACAGLALVSWNNKPVSDAIPLFKELFVPALAPLEGPLEQVISRISPLYLSYISLSGRR